MARESSVLIGSCLTPGMSSMPRHSSDQERHAVGTAIAILNPEDASIGGRLLIDQVTVGTTPTLLPASGHLPYRRSIAIQNLGGDTLYIGNDASVDPTTGWAIMSMSVFSIECKNNVQIWAVSAGISDIRTIQASQII